MPKKKVVKKSKKQSALGVEIQRDIDRTLQIRAAQKTDCPHRRDDGSQNIKWMEHSNHIIMGVCGSCFSPFDCRDPKDMALFLTNPRAQITMGRVKPLPTISEETLEDRIINGLKPKYAEDVKSIVPVKLSFWQRLKVRVLALLPLPQDQAQTN